MGLLVVAVSVRTDILTSHRAASTRAAQALILLTIPFVAGVLVLIPDQPSRPLGLELLLAAAVSGAALAVLDHVGQVHARVRLGVCFGRSRLRRLPGALPL